MGTFSQGLCHIGRQCHVGCMPPESRDMARSQDLALGLLLLNCNGLEIHVDPQRHDKHLRRWKFDLMLMEMRTKLKLMVSFVHMLQVVEALSA
jgi:hypothetical protein